MIRWPSTGVRRISLNSFGFGGANAHVIIDDAHSYLMGQGIFGFHNTQPATADKLRHEASSTASPYISICNGEAKPKLLVFSANDEQGLERMSSVFEEYLTTAQVSRPTSDFLRNFAYTLACRRTHFP